MALIVKKFGGSSVANKRRILNVAKNIVNDYNKGNNILVVVSAQGNTTDKLIKKAKEIEPELNNISKRETDMLLSAGEQISVALLAIAIETFNCPVVSLLGWQVGILTDSNFSNAKIKSIGTKRITEELNKKKIVIVAGFQGITDNNNITTLGRGGSDTTAVAIASVLKADICQIYTDVDGVFTADPKIIKSAEKLNEISYDSMLEYSTSGAKVLHNRSVEVAKLNNVPLEVLSTYSGKKGTEIKLSVNNPKTVTGITCDENVARISVIGVALESHREVITKILNTLYINKISVKMISLSEHNISLITEKNSVEEAIKILHKEFFE